MIDWKALTTKERADAVRARIKDGYGSARSIAESLGTTRNSVIGVATRNKIKLPGFQSQRDGATETMRKARPKRQEPVAAPPPTPGHRKALPRAERDPEPAFIPEGKAFIDLAPGDCKWALWDRLPADASQAKHCGERADGDGPWCTHHKHRAELRA